jgi:hypothetical protein
MAMLNNQRVNVESLCDGWINVLVWKKQNIMCRGFIHQSRGNQLMWLLVEWLWASLLLTSLVYWICVVAEIYEGGMGIYQGRGCTVSKTGLLPSFKVVIHGYSWFSPPGNGNSDPNSPRSLEILLKACVNGKAPCWAWHQWDMLPWPYWISGHNLKV